MTATDRATEDVRGIVAAFLADHPEVPGVSLAVAGEGGDTDELTVTAGVADPATGEPLEPRHAVRIASSTKPFVASCVLVLAGRGLLDLDLPAAEQVDDVTAALLRAHPNGRVATVRQLLRHTSGLPDHTHHEPFASTIAVDPRHEWSALDHLRNGLATPPVGAPGERFSYSDTGYVLLGLLIEHATGGPLATAVRDATALDRLGLASVRWELAEPEPAGHPRAHQLYDGVDTFDWHPSLDLFGGGGLVAAPLDVARWWRALFAGDVHPHLDAQLADTVDTVAPDGTPFPPCEAMSLGIMRSRVDDHLMFGHGGFWGTREHWLPAARCAVALAVTNRTATVDPSALVADVVRAISRRR